MTTELSSNASKTTRMSYDHGLMEYGSINTFLNGDVENTIQRKQNKTNDLLNN